MKNMLLFTGIQAQDGVGQEVIGVIERDKIATHEADTDSVDKGNEWKFI